MVKLLYGEPGTGKSRVLIEGANSIAKEQNEGRVAFITRGTGKMFEVNYCVRYVDVNNYDVSEPSEFLGFIHGLIAYDYDIKHIYIDNLCKVLDKSEFIPENVLEGLKNISTKFDISINVSMTGQGDVPESLQSYVS